MRKLNRRSARHGMARKPHQSSSRAKRVKRIFTALLRRSGEAPVAAVSER